MGCRRPAEVVYVDKRIKLFRSKGRNWDSSLLRDGQFFGTVSFSGTIEIHNLLSTLAVPFILNSGKLSIDQYRFLRLLKYNKSNKPIVVKAWPTVTPITPAFGGFWGPAL